MNFDIEKVDFEAANPQQKKVAATLIYDADPHLFAYKFKNDYKTALKLSVESLNIFKEIDFSCCFKNSYQFIIII